jgi:hypothetical protein
MQTATDNVYIFLFHLNPHGFHNEDLSAEAFTSTAGADVTSRNELFRIDRYGYYAKRGA